MIMENEISSFPFLGLFINKEISDSNLKKLLMVKFNKTQNLLGNKLFKTMIKEDSHAIRNFIIDTDLKKLKKTNLFDEFSMLTDEILDRLR